MSINLIYAEGYCAEDATPPRAGIGIFFDMDNGRNISEIFHDDNPTPSRAKLGAIKRVLEIMEDKPGEILSIYTNSVEAKKYLCNFSPKSQEAMPKETEDLIKVCLEMIMKRNSRPMFMLLETHDKVYGNQKARKYAKLAVS